MARVWREDERPNTSHGTTVAQGCFKVGELAHQVVGEDSWSMDITLRSTDAGDYPNQHTTQLERNESGVSKSRVWKRFQTRKEHSGRTVVPCEN